MTYKINAQHFANVLKLPAPKRYEYFVKRVAGWQQAWTLQGERGWRSGADEDGASADCGIRVLRVCPGCGLTDYSRITKPTRLIDESRWDGTDLFRVAPVEGFIFVTDRVIQALCHARITGWKARTLSEMQASFDNVLLVNSTQVNERRMIKSHASKYNIQNDKS